MNRADSRNAVHKPDSDEPVQELLQDLDHEANSLSPEIVNRLASARQRAIMASQAHHVSAGHRNGHIIRKRDGAKANQPSSWTEDGFLHHCLDRLLHVRPLTASMATASFAALAAVLVFNTAEPEIDQRESLAMATPESEMATNSETIDAENAFVKASSLNVVSSGQSSVLASEDSLDLVGSVDFLLWLDSQQS